MTPRRSERTGKMTREKVLDDQEQMDVNPGERGDQLESRDDAEEGAFQEEMSVDRERPVPVQQSRGVKGKTCPINSSSRNSSRVR